MYGQLLQSVETLIEHLDFHPLSLDSRFTEDDLDAYRIKLARYLRGTGHPANLPGNVLPSTMRQGNANTKLYRARRFLKCSTGLSTVPTNPDWKIIVCYSNNLTYIQHFYFILEITLTDQVPGDLRIQQPVGADTNWQVSANSIRPLAYLQTF